jgi:predicted amidohydrolase
MANKLTVALVQTHLYWEHPQNNKKHFEQHIESIEEAVDVIILPEMFTSGFTMEPQKVAEAMNGETVQWLKALAQSKQAAITGSIVIKEDDYFYNRLLFVEPSGNISYYNKRHTFSLAGEDKVYKAGNDKVIITYKGWKLCPMICYDLRFPVWSRNVEDYDVLFYVANWPERRIAAWDALLRARAIENMAYCIGVNRVGTDGNGHPYVGHSAAYDVLGNSLAKPIEGESTVVVSLDKSHIEEHRTKLKFLNDRDRFNLID